MVPSVDDLIAAPVGLALLDRLEVAERERFVPFVALADSDPSAVEEAVHALESFVAGAPLLVNLCGKLQAGLRAFGGHSLRLMLGEDELARTRIGVRLAS